MNKNIVTVLLLALSLFAAAACERQPPPPPPEPENAPPPEPTPEEYRAQMKGTMGQLLQPGAPPPPDMTIQDIINQMQSRRLQLTATDNGRGALQLITTDVDEAIRGAREEEQWVKIKALCMVYAALQPGNERYNKLMEQAQIMINRPKITVTGFVELDGELYAFIDLFDPKTGQSTNYRCREGEEFHGVMRLVRIIGNQQSIEVEYLPARYVWNVPGPRERAKSGS